MAYETKPNTGSLFKNDKREADTHPHYKGSAVINGVDYWLDSWINESKSGDKYMSLKFKPKDQQGVGGGVATSRKDVSWNESLDGDDVPFMSADPAWEHRVG